MRVLYFHQHFSTPGGAAGTRSYEMARRLIHHGHDVTMVCGRYGVGKTGIKTTFRNGSREDVVDGIRIIEFELDYSNADSLLRRTGTFAKFAMSSVALAMRENYDVVFATTTPLTAGIPGIFARWLRGKPFVFEVRDLWPELPREMGVITNPLVLGAMSFLEWASYRSAHRCVALSPGIAKGIEKRGVAPEKIVMVPNGCDIDIFENPEEPAWRPGQIKDEDFLAIYTGTHGQANGLSSVLDGAAELMARGRDDIKILLVGDGKLKPELQKQAETQQLKNVVFQAPVPKRKLAGLMAASDLGIQSLANVSAFYFGTSPNKFFDYIAAGLPVLNNYPGWLAGLIEKHDCGWAVKPEDPVALADALEEAADDRENTICKGANAGRLARKEFNRKELADRWVSWVTGATHRH